MPLRFSRTLAPSLLIAALLAGCASGPAVDPQITAALSARGVPDATYRKIAQGQALDYADIVSLVEKDVPTHIVVSYLQSTEKVYNFSCSQLKALKSDGAAPQLLNYLSETEGFYGHSTPASTARTQKHQNAEYYNSPLYQDEQPFAYNAPEVDDWYDSGYEESLYSPFSMD